MNGGSLVVAGLLAHGVDTVFGIPGTHNLEIYRALAGSGIRHVTPRHEQGAGYAADGYARTSGRPGVAIVTTGPALLNIAAAVGQAYSDSVPVLVISPGVPLTHPGRGNGLLHETKDQSAALAAIAGRSHRVTSHAEIITAITQAFAEFTSVRPRPIHLEIPLDLLAAPIPDAAADGRVTRGGGLPRIAPLVVPPRRPDPWLVSAAIEELDAARRPAIIAGGGAKHAPIRELAERRSAPVFTTTNGKGIVPEDHPLSVTSALHLPGVNAFLDACDVILAIGTELASTDFWYGSPRWLARLIRVDIDPAQLIVNAIPDIAIVGDAKATVEELLSGLSRVPANDRAGQARAAIGAQARAEGARWLPWLDAIDAALSDVDAIIAADNAMCCYYGALGNLPVRRPGGYCFPTGYGTLGYAVPAAIGASLANPGSRVVALSGDGGLMFSVQEIATAAAERISLPVVVFNNRGYGEIRAEMVAAGIPTLGVDLPAPDFLALAAALGGHGVQPPTPADLATELAAACRRPGPTLLLVDEPEA